MAQAQQPSNTKTETLEMNASQRSVLGIDDLTGKRTIMSIGSDDYVVMRNIFDGTKGRPSFEMIMKWNNQGHRWKPGQVVNLPGYKARNFLLHLVKTLYLRVDNDPMMDKNDYPLDDKYVKEALISIQPMMGSEEQATDEIQELPDYVANDENLSSIAGRGEQELATVKIEDEPPATDESEAKYDDPAHNITPTTIAEKKAAAKGGEKSPAKEAGRLPQ